MLFSIAFDDGIEWLLRLSNYSDGTPADLRRRIAHSEVLSHRLLEDQGVPVPKIYHWNVGAISKTNSTAAFAWHGFGADPPDPRCVYSMMERLEGSNCGDTLDSALTDELVTEEHMRAMATGWAKLSIALESTPYEAMGSPDLDDAGNIVIGNLLQGVFPDMPVYPYFAGPFRSQRERWLNRIDRLISHTKMGWTVNDQPLVVYLGLQHARSLVAAHESFSKEETKFYIKHPDSHGGNVMAKGTRITGLIDWEG
jgi:hypothetical protein